MEATEADEESEGFADLDAIEEAEDAAAERLDEMLEAAEVAAAEADEAEAYALTLATEAAEVALAAAYSANELAELIATFSAEDAEACARSYFSSRVSLEDVKSSRTEESFSSANSTPELIVSRMLVRICSTLFCDWT